MPERMIACSEDEECNPERYWESIDTDFRPVSGRLTGRMHKDILYILYYTFAPRTLRYNAVRCRAFEYIDKG